MVRALDASEQALSKAAFVAVPGTLITTSTDESDPRIRVLVLPPPPPFPTSEDDDVPSSDSSSSSDIRRTEDEFGRIEEDDDDTNADRTTLRDTTDLDEDDDDAERLRDTEKAAAVERERHMTRAAFVMRTIVICIYIIIRKNEGEV